MNRVFGFSFRSGRSALVFAVGFMLFALLYQTFIERSIRSHPDVVQLTVREHCRHVIGKDVGNLPSSEFLEKLERCDRFRVRKIEAAGGLINPVLLKVTLDESADFPIAQSELVFRSLYTNLSLSDSLHGLMSGQWAFNHFNSYSSGTFRFTL